MTVIRLLAGSKIALAGVVAASAVAGAAAFYAATQLSAEIVNRGQSVTLGTLVLSNKVGGGATCLSAPDLATDQNAQTCDTAFDLKVRKPGDTATADVEIGNIGSLDAGALRVFAPACVDSDADPLHGSGSPCAKLQLFIQLWTDTTRSVPAACVYGGSLDGRRCDFSDAAKTIGAFAADHASVTSAVVIGPLRSGERDYFTIGVRLPTDANNAYQGRRATTSFAWQITQ